MLITIIIPVYREHDHISRSLHALENALSAVSHEIIIVDGEPGASTLAFLNAGPPLGSVVRLISSRRGRGPQMNAGAQKAGGDLLFFVHADSRPDPEGVNAMATAWQASASPLFCGAFDLAIDSDKPVFRIIEKTASLRSRLTRIPYGDQGIFISRDLFNHVGGFPDQPLMEDVGLMAAIKKTGVKPVLIKEKMRTSARRWEDRGIVYTTLGNWLFITLYALGVSPERLSAWYYGIE